MEGCPELRPQIYYNVIARDLSIELRLLALHLPR
jgi:hypothetical protein